MTIIRHDSREIVQLAEGVLEESSARSLLGGTQTLLDFFIVVLLLLGIFEISRLGQAARDIVDVSCASICALS